MDANTSFDIDMESVGERIKNRRKELHLTQTDIFNHCGIRSGSLSRIENGTNVPSIILFYKIAQFLKCDMEWLLTGNYSNMKSDATFVSEDPTVDRSLLIQPVDENVHYLLYCFNKMSFEDKTELLTIAKMKAEKAKRKGESSSNSAGNEIA